MTKRAYVGIVILALLVGLLIGYCVLTPTWHVPLQLKYDVLKDTLTIVLAVLAVGIAVVGYAIYLILSGRLEHESASASRIEVTRGATRVSAHLGYIFWVNYERTRTEPQYLDMAISLTERAHGYFDELPEREVKKRENEILLCVIKNNSAYYLAERNRPEDKGLAIEFAEFIRDKASKYHEHRDNWLDTCTFVDNKYPT